IWTIISRETQAVFIGWVRCPHCLEYQVMEFSKESWWWPHDEEGHSIDRKEILARKLARYVCRLCAAEWTDHDRNQAIQHIVFRHVPDPRMLTGEVAMSEGEEMRRYMRQHRPASIGFILPSWISYQVSLSEVAHDFLRAQDKELAPEDRFKAYQDFQNKHRALPWRVEQHSRPVSAILALKDDRPAGLVPGDGRVAGLVAGVDTQDNGWYFDIWAIGWGFTREMWRVYGGFVDSTTALDKVLFSDSYRDSAGLYYPVHTAVIDSGGHRTDDVYDYARARQGRVIAYKGASGRRNTPLTWSKVDTYPGTSRAIPGGLRLLIADSGHYKDRLSAKLKVAPEDPGALHLHGETDEEYAAHYCAEYLDKNNNWVCKPGRPNHYWDCTVMAIVSASVLRIETWNKGG
ncbi:MAG: terminase gpA endonuclease subunit, partial [Desulfobulbaceae bacterium]